VERPPDATHELHFRGGRELVVHAPERTLGCAQRVVCLHEVGCEPVASELTLTKGACEEPPVVTALLESDDVGSCERRLAEDHRSSSGGIAALASGIAGCLSRLSRLRSIRNRTNCSPSNSFLPKPCSTIRRWSSSMPEARSCLRWKPGSAWARRSKRTR